MFRVVHNLGCWIKSEQLHYYLLNKTQRNTWLTHPALAFSTIINDCLLRISLTAHWHRTVRERRNKTSINEVDKFDKPVFLAILKISINLLSSCHLLGTWETADEDNATHILKIIFLINRYLSRFRSLNPIEKLRIKLLIYWEQSRYKKRRQALHDTIGSRQVSDTYIRIYFTHKVLHCVAPSSSATKKRTAPP